MARLGLHTPGMSNGTPPPKKRGCLFYGCLSVAVVAILMAIMFAVGVFVVRKLYVNTVNQCTDAAPTKFEAVQYSAPEHEALQARVQSFQDALKQGRGDFELVLSADDLNALIQDNPQLKEKLLVSIEGDKVKGRISLPLDEVVPPEVRKQLTSLQGRFLNAEVVFRIALESGALDVRLEQIDVRGKPLEKVHFLGPAIADMKKRNLATDIQKDPKVRDNIRRFESLQVRDGKVILKGKSQP